MALTNALIEGRYLHDLLEQGDALRLTLDQALPSGLARIAAKLGNENVRLILTGMGSSFHALHPTAVRLARSGILSTMLETSELIYYWEKLLTPNTIVIAVSQSGRSAEIVRLMELNAGRAQMIAVTNDPDSPLAQGADERVMIRAGKESTVSCKTYLCTLLALHRLSGALCGLAEDESELHAVPGQVDSYMDHWRNHVAQAVDHLHTVDSLVIAGRGASLATAGTGGLIIKEAARFPAEGMSAAAFRHGPLEMVSERLLLLVLEGDSQARVLNEKLAREVTELGGRACLVGTGAADPLLQIPKTTDGLGPIMEMLPVQMFSLALAARAGREAGAFARATKITATE